MQNRTIEDIYAANDHIHEDLKATVENLTGEQISSRPEGENWTIAQIVEHIALVDGGALQICRKLLSQIEPEDEKNDGFIVISDNFREKAARITTVKLEAPERVQPKGEQTIPESLAKIDENHLEFEKLRPLFNSVKSCQQSFPHPFMGNLTAHEWFVLAGAHEARHIAQIKRFIENYH